MDISLSFVYSTSEAYKEKLQKFMNDLVAEGRTANRPPDISFPGINDVSYREIQNLMNDYDDQWGTM